MGRVCLYLTSEGKGEPVCGQYIESCDVQPFGWAAIQPSLRVLEEYMFVEWYSQCGPRLHLLCLYHLLDA